MRKRGLNENRAAASEPDKGGQGCGHIPVLAAIVASGNSNLRVFVPPPSPAAALQGRTASKTLLLSFPNASLIP